MFEHLNHFLSRISVQQLNILFLLGLALFGGAIGGRLFQKLRIPQVVGYIAIGILIGESGLKFIDQATVEALQPFNYFALGLIGFIIGGELKRDVLRKYGKQFISILLFEGTGAFILVTVLIGITGSFLLKDWRLSWSLGLLLGAISSATAPAATAAVLKEFKTRGPLTRTILGIVAMDDALALMLFAIASSIAGSLMGNVDSGLFHQLVDPLYEIGGAIFVGIISGLILTKLLKKYTEEGRLLAFSIGAVLIVLGVSLATNIDMLLAAMSLGVIVTNFIPRRSKEIFKLVEGFTPPIFVLFFVLVGAKLNVNYMTLSIVVFGVVYILGRSAGKAIGANFGARISRAARSVRKYLPLCLFSQAGVAIGLSILASHYFPGYIGSAVIIIVTTTAFVLEVIGPPFIKLAVTKAGEVGMNITEDDFVRKLKIEEIMDKNPPFIYKNTPLGKILAIFSDSPNLYYPVVDNAKKLIGIITVDNIKNTFMVASLSDLVLAVDVMEPAIASIRSNASIAELKEILIRHNLEYLPVVTAEDVVVGFIERRMFYKVISTKIMELQRQADSLERDS